MSTASALSLRPDVGLLTLTGPGGVGKTRLALQIGWHILDAFDDGVILVELASLRDPSLVAATIAQVLGLADLRGRRPEDAVLDLVRELQMVLLLDNFEHLLEAGPVIGRLLSGAPGLTILVTSRAALRIQGEHVLPVAPLSLPEQRPGESPACLLEYGAVSLFARRAAAIRRGFKLTAENGQTIADICARVDGLPLAIELAAARVRTLTPHEILTRLDRRLALLTDGVRDVPSRHHDLRAAIGWTYDLLGEHDRFLFRRLAIFVGGFTLAAAEAICQSQAESRGATSVDQIDALGSLTRLMDYNLVQHADDAVGGSRFTMLETIREYAQERLEAHGEVAVGRQLHADFYVSLANEAQPLFEGPNRHAWVARFQQEHDNVRAALTWTVEDPGRTAVGVKMVAALFWFWRLRGHWSEANGWLVRLLDRARAFEPIPIYAQALSHGGMIAFMLSDYSTAQARLEASRALWQQLGEGPGLADALIRLGLVRRIRGDYAARGLQQQAIAMWRRLGHRAGLGGALFMLGSSPGTAEDHATAGPILEESAAIFHELGDPWARARPLLTLGINALQRGEYADSQRKLEEALTTFRELGDHWYAARALSALGRIALENQDQPVAAARYREALFEYQRLADLAGVADCLEGLAAARSTDAFLGARLLGAVDALRERNGIHLDPFDRAAFDQSVASLQARLGARVFAEQWECGRSEGTAAIVDQFLNTMEPSGLTVVASGSGRRRSVPFHGALTTREKQVAGLIARGYTNRRLAAMLGITERTAEVHARNIREKLGFSARAQIAAWAVEHGLHRTSQTD